LQAVLVVGLESIVVALIRLARKAYGGTCGLVSKALHKHIERLTAVIMAIVRWSAWRLTLEERGKLDILRMNRSAGKGNQSCDNELGCEHFDIQLFGLVKRE